ncbi:MAG TPA: hypothetical protein VFO84_10580, partial [Dehalococcoidia bacterium]|nr:hypothetical protein [Dehalococcoidia bacterium]
MSLLSKWTLGGGLAVAALLAAFSLFGGTASAGLDDPGELIRGDLECDKIAEDGDLEEENIPGFGEGSISSVHQGDPITYDITCDVNLPGFDEGDPILIGDISINDQLPDNFEIEFATCEVEDGIFAVSGFGFPFPTIYPAQVNGQNVTCVFPSPFVPGFFPTQVEMEIDGRYNEAPCGTIKNIAVAEMGGDTEVAEHVIFVECLDVSVTKTASTVTDSTGATVLAGGTIIYVVEVCNVAPAPSLVNNAGFFDQLPLGTQFQSSASADFDLAFDATSSQILGTTDQLQA